MEREDVIPFRKFWTVWCILFTEKTKLFFLDRQTWWMSSSKKYIFWLSHRILALLWVNLFYLLRLHWLYNCRRNVLQIRGCFSDVVLFNGLGLFRFRFFPFQYGDSFGGRHVQHIGLGGWRASVVLIWKISWNWITTIPVFQEGFFFSRNHKKKTFRISVSNHLLLWRQISVKS